MLIAFFEGGGYVGIWLLNEKYIYSDMIVLPESVRPDWYGKPYFRLRDILIGKKDCYPRFYASYNLNYENYPGFIDHGVVQNNEDGYRGKKINCAKGNKFRILFLGGSTTYGMVLHPEETFPAQTEKILNEEIKKYPSKWDGVEIINAGIIGGLLSDELHHYLFKYRYYKPDLVVVYSAINDANNDLTSSGFTPDYATLRTPDGWQIEHVVPGWMMRSYFISFVVIATYYHPHNVDLETANTYTQANPAPDWFPDELAQKLKQGDLGYNPFYNNFNTLIREIKSDNAQVLIIPPALNPKFKSYFKKFDSPFYERADSCKVLMQKVALKYNVEWLDYKYESIQPQWWFDHCHVTAPGEKEKGQLVAAKILSMMFADKK